MHSAFLSQTPSPREIFVSHQRLGCYTLVGEAFDVGAIFDCNVSVVEYRSNLFDAAQAEGLALSEISNKKLMRFVNIDKCIDMQLLKDFEEYPKTRAALVHQIELLADIADCQQVGVRLVVMNSPMCPAMHVDRVSVRTVWTVMGESTEFLAGRADSFSDDRVEAIRAKTGSMVILKGTLWGDDEQLAAKHRSPHVDEVRVVFTLDPL